VDSRDYPFVAPGLLRRADAMCPRRLRRDFDGLERERAPQARFRVRDRIVDAARQAHSVARPPSLAHFPVPVDLIVEETALFERAAASYVELFGSVAARALDHGCEAPTVHHQRGLLIGGFVDLLLETDADDLVLRQLDVSGYRDTEPVLERATTKVALLRLARAVGARRLTVEAANLVAATVDRAAVRVEAELDGLRAWFDARMAIVHRRAADPVAIAGADCGPCRHVAGCPAHRTPAPSVPAG